MQQNAEECGMKRIRPYVCADVARFADQPCMFLTSLPLSHAGIPCCMPKVDV